jgi:hypothetical protein
MSWLAIHAAGRREVRVDVGLFGIVFPVVWNRCRGGELHFRELEPDRRMAQAGEGASTTSLSAVCWRARSSSLRTAAGAVASRAD